MLARPGSQGSGVAIGVLPHVIPYLRDGMLCAPFGREAVAHRGTFFVVRRPDVAERKPVQAFVAWLWHEVEQEGEFTLASARSKQRAHRAVAKAQSGGSIRR